jgi:hypothetical protein
MVMGSSQQQYEGCSNMKQLAPAIICQPKPRKEMEEEKKSEKIDAALDRVCNYRPVSCDKLT